ncbi:hypothetical protein [Solicola sp. PLA-1-18]|uniref:hypothetical protein n=1 Tax=Solicola sp. PLA-1-18 TaxID=3380532 RepID=UPI003B81A84A
MSEPWIRLTPLVPRTPRLPWRPVAVTVVLFVVASLAAGVVWEHLASPPGWVVSQGEGYRAGVEESTAQFGVVAWFVACSAVPALLLGVGLAWRLHRLSWPFVLLLTVVSSLASLVTWRLGVLLGPADPTGTFSGLADGTRVPGAMELDAHGALLVWPVATLLGVVLVVAFLVPETEEPEIGADEPDQGWAGFAPDPEPGRDGRGGTVWTHRPAGPAPADPRNP